MNQFFSSWQRRSIGNILTFAAWVAAGVIALWIIAEIAHGIAFLQPVLIPFAVAVVLAFLLEPVVRYLCAKTRWSRLRVVFAIFAVVALAGAAAGVWIVPRVYQSVSQTVRDLPTFAKKAQERLVAFVGTSETKLAHLEGKLPPAPIPGPLAIAPKSGVSSVPVHSTPNEKAKPPGDLSDDGKLDAADLRGWLQEQLPKWGQEAPQLLQRAGGILLKTVGGFLGSFGLLLNAIIIPIYLFFLLVEGNNIAKKWTDYLPIKDSQPKQEVVSIMQEIHVYLTAFFRGQLIVSTIDATLIGTALAVFLHLKFSLFIALLVLVLTFIPYLGILICYVPAILVAFVQYGDLKHPLYAVLIMFAVQTLESTIISPKIVGESTGLHPLTVIISVFVWSTVLDGPIGAILAVPLTASLKVIMRRFIWERARVHGRLLPTAKVQPVLRAGDRDRFGDGDPDFDAVPAAVAHPKEKPQASSDGPTATPLSEREN
jgi:predicted PurR-regulated permease PerM